MNKERFEIELNQEDVQNIINCYEKDIEYINQLQQQNKELHNKIDKAIEALDGIRKIIETEKRLMGYAIYDSCLLLIEEQLDKAKDLKDSDVDDNR